LLADLLARGVERRVAELAIDETLTAEEVDAFTQARRLAEQRVARMRSVPAAKQVRRIVAFLARRGYVGQDVREMIRGVVGKTGG
jgi:SOS response regulatory protein OraA/RecX